MKSQYKVTLIVFWKEIIFICFISSILFHLPFCRLSRSTDTVDNEHFFKPISVNESQREGLANSVSVRPDDSPENSMRSPLKFEGAISPEEGEHVEVRSRFFHDFKFMSMLGKGGFGIVYQCKHEIDQKEYAIKQINLPDRKISQEKIFREVHALAHLDHPNILRYYQSWVEEPPKEWYERKAKEVFLCSDANAIDQTDFESLLNPSVRLMSALGEDENCMLTFRNSDSSEDKEENNSGTNQEESKAIVPVRPHPFKNTFPMLFIQVELCRCSLDLWLNYGDTPPKNKGNNPLGNKTKVEIFHIFQQLACAIDHVHAKGLMHRDLKPANIFFNADKTLKLGDFGLVAFKCGTRSNLSEAVKSKLTIDKIKNTSEIGTYLYMAPEVLEGKVYSQKVDIYSMGVIFYEVLSLFKTYSEKITKLKFLRHAKFSPEFQTNYSHELSLIKKMILRNPKKRLAHEKVLNQVNKFYQQFTEEI